MFVNEHFWIMIKISLNFVPKGPIDNKPALVQVMLGAEQATRQYLKQCLVHLRMYVAQGGDELTCKYTNIYIMFD